MKIMSFAIPFFLAVLLGGCAKTDITSRQEYGGGKLPRPSQIIVHDFSATPADVPADSALAGRQAPHATPQTAEEIETGRKLGAQVAKELTAEIRKMGLPAVRATSGPTPRVGDLVIKGHFISVEEGSAGKRVLVGFGKGAADLTAMVEGYQVTEQGLHLLGSGKLESESGKMPGVVAGAVALAATGSPIGLIVGGAAKIRGEKKGTQTIEGAAKMTADEIVEQLQVKFKEQGWI
jgi:hypothetical protein